MTTPGLLTILVLLVAHSSWAAARQQARRSLSDRLADQQWPLDDRPQSPPLFRYYVLGRQGEVERTFLSPHDFAALPPGRHREALSGAPSSGGQPQLDSVVATIGTIVNAEAAAMGERRHSAVTLYPETQGSRYPDPEIPDIRDTDWGTLESLYPDPDPEMHANRHPDAEDTWSPNSDLGTQDIRYLDPETQDNPYSEMDQMQRVRYHDSGVRYPIPVSTVQGGQYLSHPETESGDSSPLPMLTYGSEERGPATEGPAETKTETQQQPEGIHSEELPALSEIAGHDLEGPLYVSDSEDPSYPSEVDSEEPIHMLDFFPSTPAEYESLAPGSGPVVLPGALRPAEMALLSRLNVQLVSDPEVAMMTEVPLGKVAYLQADVPDLMSAAGEHVGYGVGRVGAAARRPPPASRWSRPAMPVGVRPFSAAELLQLLPAGGHEPYLYESISSRLIPHLRGGAVGADGADAAAVPSAAEQQQAGQAQSTALINRQTLSPDHQQTMKNLMHFLMDQSRPNSTSPAILAKNGHAPPANANENSFETGAPNVLQVSTDSYASPGALNAPTAASDSWTVPELASAATSSSDEQLSLDPDDLILVPSEHSPLAGDGGLRDRPEVGPADRPEKLEGRPEAGPADRPEELEVRPEAGPADRPEELEGRPEVGPADRPEELEGSGAGPESPGPQSEPPATLTFTLSSLFRPGIQASGGHKLAASAAGGSGHTLAGLTPAPPHDHWQRIDALALAEADSEYEAQVEPVAPQTELTAAQTERVVVGGDHGGHEGHAVDHSGDTGVRVDHKEVQGEDHDEHHGGHHGEDHGGHGEHHGGDHGDDHGEHNGGDHGEHHGAHHGGGHGEHHHGDHAPAENSVSLLQPSEGSLGLEDSLDSLDEETKTFVDNNNRLALSIHRTLAPDYRTQNMVLSPLGVASSLSMLFLGSRGDTADELDALLKLDSMTAFNPHVGFFKFIRYINEDRSPHTTGICNILYKQVDKGEMFSGYHSLIHRFYRPVIKAYVDLAAVVVQRDVNRCMSQVTDGQVSNFATDSKHIPGVAPSIATATATFFNATLSPSLDVQSVDMPFLRFPSAQRRVVGTAGLRVRGLMSAGYSAELDCTVAALPYSGGQLQLVLLLPGTAPRFNVNGLADLESQLTADRWQQLARAATPQPLEVTVPIVAHWTAVDLRTALRRLGVSAVSEPQRADFSGVNGIRDLTLGGLLQLTEFHLGDSAVLHRGFVHHGADGDHGGHGDHEGHGDHGAHANHGESGDHGSHVGHEGHTDHGQHTNNADQSDAGAQVSARSTRSVGSLWVVGGARLPWERVTSDGPRPAESAPPELRGPVATIKFERAFMYAVRHTATGAILLTGRFLDPHSFV